MNPHVTRIRSRVLAAQFEVSIDTLDRWARLHGSLADCRVCRGWWDVRKLRANGWLLPASEVAHV